jgi:hypothetical protein
LGGGPQLAYFYVHIDPSPIHTSPITGSFAVVATLLELGADMRARNAAGNTPAHTAALNGHVEAMEEFMSSGFDVKTTNGRGQTVLHLAAVATKVRYGTLDIYGIGRSFTWKALLQIRIRICTAWDQYVFGPPGSDPYPLVRDPVPDSSIIKQK